LLQTWQTSGTAKFGHGSVVGGGPASWQSLVQSKYPLTLQLQEIEHPPGPLLVVPHPSPGMHAPPGAQPTGGGGGQVTLH
jgi:hypothetical protein